MAILLTYDVNNEWDKVKEQMIQNYGYEDTMPRNLTNVAFTRGGHLPSGALAKYYNLPNTTLYHDNATPQNAKSHIEEIAGALGIALLYFVAVEITSNRDGIEGKTRIQAKLPPLQPPAYKISKKK